MSVIAKGFSDVQLRWSAMERELYALWQGVVGMERRIKGFRTFCYMDHKNNLFTSSLLGNRRVNKQFLRWALDLEEYGSRLKRDRCSRGSQAVTDAVL